MNEFFTSLLNYNYIIVLIFCHKSLGSSGMVVSKLAKYESTIDAAVILHPGPITVDDINGTFFD